MSPKVAQAIPTSMAFETPYSSMNLGAHAIAVEHREQAREHERGDEPTRHRLGNVVLAKESNLARQSLAQKEDQDRDDDQPSWTKVQWYCRINAPSLRLEWIRRRPCVGHRRL